eukprot:m.89286 g.89286  ORF g.89286 m.89286 type:complete len:1208 (-) comp26282_c0_seq1:76-3699(-)
MSSYSYARVVILIAGVVLVASLNLRGVEGCAFHCLYHHASPSEDTSICAGPVVRLTESMGTGLQYAQDSSEDMTSAVARKYVRAPHLTIDLSDRNITSISPDGLACYSFEPYVYEYAYYIENGYKPARTVLRSIILDNNGLTAFPHAPSLINASYISIKNNSISNLENFDVFLGAMLSDQVNISLDYNRIETLPALFNQADSVEFVDQNIGVSLTHNLINAVPEEFFNGSQTGLQFACIILDDNKISSLPEGLFNSTGGFYLQFLVLSLNNNQITHFPTVLQTISSYLFDVLLLSMKNNSMTTLVDNPFLNSIDLYYGEIQVFIDDNNISVVPAGLFNGTQELDTMIFSMNQNQVSYLPDGFFSPISRTEIVVLSLDNNEVAEVGAVFRGWNTVSTVTLSLQNNYINASGFATILKSYTNGTGPLTLQLGGNDITMVPSFVFAGVGSGIIAKFAYPKISVNLQAQRNGVMSLLPDDAFSYDQNQFRTVEALVSAISLDLSDNPNLFVVSTEFNFMQSTTKGQTMLTLELQLSRTNQTMTPLNAFGAFGVDYTNFRPTRWLIVNLTSNQIDLESLSQNYYFDEGVVSVNLILCDNNIKEIQPYSFSGFSGSLDLAFNHISAIRESAFKYTLLNSINMSHNRIVEVHPDAFDVSVSVTHLDLGHNKISSIITRFTDNTPVLQQLVITGNKVQSLPMLIGNNRIFNAADADDNVLRCESYSPHLSNCTCAGDLVYNTFCGYGRCTRKETGCEGSAMPTEDCKEAPRSVCLSSCVAGSYMLASDRVATCLFYTNCSTAFTNGTQGYEFRSPTSSTDRVCSACSVCPGGFDSIACNATANTVCTRTFRLSDGDLAAIVLVLLLVFVGTLGGTSFMFMYSKGAETEQQLEMSQMLLGEVNEANSRMRKAWEIREGDLTFEKSLASGSFGEVWSATWGHIPVAVKTLHAYLAEFPDEMVEFEREAIFMQSIRHPNLLIFYGAGIKTDGAPFLVVELMAKGAMSRFIKEEHLAWTTRSRFALEIAQGMAHLHGLDSMHRDLKSDNCLVDDRLHVKVADFGNSRLISAYYGGELEPKAPPISESRMSVHSNRNSDYLTLEVGTLLWMAPELMGRRNNSYGKEVDVYSFGIVMWELLTLKTPWENEFSLTSTVGFRRELTQLLFSGQRPQLPTYSTEKQYAAFVTLMTKCWGTEPDTRPTFANVAAMLIDIAGTQLS